MTIHEMRLIYKNYEAEEWLLEIEKTLDRQIEIDESEEMKRSRREVQTRLDLSPVTNKE